MVSALRIPDLDGGRNLRCVERKKTLHANKKESASSYTCGDSSYLTNAPPGAMSLCNCVSVSCSADRTKVCTNVDTAAQTRSWSGGPAPAWPVIQIISGQMTM